MNFGDIYCSYPSFSSSSHMHNTLLLIHRSKATYSAGAVKGAVWAASFRLTPPRIAAIQLVVHCLDIK